MRYERIYESFCAPKVYLFVPCTDSAEYIYNAKLHSGCTSPSYYRSAQLVASALEQ